MNERTKKRLISIAAFLYGLIFGGAGLLFLWLMFGFPYNCPACGRLVKEGAPFCPRCFARLCWG